MHGVVHSREWLK
jgi:hypothetical protein